MWFTQKSTRATLIAISSSLNGATRKVRSSKTKAQLRRDQMLINCDLLPKEKQGTTLLRSTPRGKPASFGHCVETVPFVFVRSIQDDIETDSAKGLSLHIQSIIPQMVSCPYVYAPPNPNCFVDSCANCLFLIRRLSFNEENFKAPKSFSIHESPSSLPHLVPKNGR
ncbi:hypothetical protein BDR07DRAFT_707967 [Suillus spraguei]|nr:hypothetical protein BDR07DRAFT_707967 [Suillus spraguei]